LIIAIKWKARYSWGHICKDCKIEDQEWLGTKKPE